MHRRIAALIALLALSTAAAMPSAASAAGRRRPKLVKPPTAAQVIRNCTRSRTGAFTLPYTVRVLRVARRAMRGDIAEYTSCFDAYKLALRRAKSKIVVGIRKRSRGGYVAGQVVIRDKRGRLLDAVRVRAGKRTTFVVPKGTYKLGVGTLRGCTRTVTVRARRTLSTALTCSAA
jgi:hypothetical protein